MITELIYLGRDNTNSLTVTDADEQPVDLSGVTRMVMSFQGSDIIVDSALHSEMITWSDDGVVTLALGALPIKPSKYFATLATFDPSHDDGQVVFHAAEGRVQLWFVAQGAAGNDESALNALAAQVGENTDAIEVLESTVATFDDRIAAVEGGNDSDDTRLDALEAADVALDGRLDTAEGEIDALQSADIALDTRLDAAEGAVVTLDGRLDTAEPTLASLAAGGATHAAAHAAMGVVTLTLLSGTANADTNTAAITAALANGGIVQILKPGTYYYGQTAVVQPSNSLLVIGPGVTMKLTGGTRRNFIRNAAQSATPKTISSLTYSAGVCTAACTGHGFEVGQWVSVLWAAESGFNGVFKVETAANANTFTYRPVIVPEAATATISLTSVTYNPGVIQVRAADVNIGLVNMGVIDQDSSVNSGTPAAAYDLHNLMYGHIHNFSYSGGGVIKNVAKYGINIFASSEILVDRPVFDTGSDGVHLTGPIIDCRVIGLSGRCDDNAVGAGTGDYADYHVSEGDLVAVSINGTAAAGNEIAPVRVFGSDKFRTYVTVDGVTGSTANVRAAECIVDSNVRPNGNVRATNLKIKNINCYTGTATTVSIVPHTAEYVEVDGVLPGSTSAGGYMVSIGSSAAYTYKTVICKNIQNSDAVNYPNLHLVGSGSGVTINDLVVDQPVMKHNQVSTGRVVELSGTVSRLTVKNPITYQGSAIVNLLAGLASTCDVTISDPQCFDTNYVINNNSGREINAAITGGTIRDTNTVFRHAGSAGTMRCRTGGVSLINNTSIIGRTASQVLEAYGWDIAADVDLLATTSGQYMRNTDAASTAGIAAGLARCEGGAWALI